jgi:alpha-N-arabinofuranosidase
MTELTRVTAHPSFTIGEVDPRLFGGFLEHLGRAVYGGVFEPGHAEADEDGCRRDVLDALDALSFTAMRWPGGNFVSGYHWVDGVGPAAERPIVRELAWKSVETNQFGTHEFLDLSQRMGWTPMLAVNLGTGTPEEAADWVEYCNSSADTRWANLRRENGRSEPWKVPLWCLGNEMDGDWQLGHVPADQYARRAQQASMQMKLVDPGIETIACGSSQEWLPTFGHWDRTVLEHLGDHVDYLSIHRYVGNSTGDVSDYLAVGRGIDRQIETIDALCRSVAGTRRSRRRVRLCIDEWNVWYRNFEMDGGWQVAPLLLEEVYDLADALVTGQFLISFLRHADVVKIANLAQIVNVIAPILTKDSGVLLQAPFHAFRMIAPMRGGVSLHVAVEGPTSASPSYGVVPMVDTAVVQHGDILHLVGVNRSVGSDAPLRFSVPGRSLRAGIGEILAGTSPDLANTWEAPNIVTPQPFEFTARDGAIEATLPPLSLVVLAATLQPD